MGFSASMMVKRQTLTDVVKQTLDAHLTDGTSFKIEQEIREALFRSTSRADRLALMASAATDGTLKIRYGCIEHIGASPTDALPTLNQTDAQTPHTFAVSLWFGFEDGVSTTLWDNLIESIDPARPGLLPELRTAKALVSDGGQIIPVVWPEWSAAYIENLGDGDRAHHLECTITLL